MHSLQNKCILYLISKYKHTLAKKDLMSFHETKTKIIHYLSLIPLPLTLFISCVSVYDLVAPLPQVCYHYSLFVILERPLHCL